MNELKSIDFEFQQIKEQRKESKNNLSLCYQHAKSITNLIARINKISEAVIQQKKPQLIKIYQKEKKSIINDIINYSYMSFMNEKNDDYENEEVDFASLLLNIQKSDFYQECKDNYKLKEMEIKYIVIEAEQNNDYKTALTKLTEKEKIIVDLSLKQEIKNYIENCKIAIINNEKKEIKKLLERKQFDEVITKYQSLIGNNDFFEYAYKEYLNVLEYIIINKLQNEKKEIPEIKLYKDFLSVYKKKIKGVKRYIKKLETFESSKDKIKEIKLEHIGNVDLIFNNNKNNKTERKNVDYYLDQIEKNIPEDKLEEFDNLKEFIYQQILNYDNEANDNYINSKKWIENRKSYKKELNDINNIGKIYSYLNHINNKSVHYNIYTIQLISLLVLSQKLSKQLKGIFCKINTGEGKSTIIQLFSAYKVLTGHKVDIISSSTVLAERDATNKERLEFFETLNMSVGVVKKGAEPYK